MSLLFPEGFFFFLRPEITGVCALSSEITDVCPLSAEITGLLRHAWPTAGLPPWQPKFTIKVAITIMCFNAPDRRCLKDVLGMPSGPLADAVVGNDALLSRH